MGLGSFSDSPSTPTLRKLGSSEICLLRTVFTSSTSQLAQTNRPCRYSASRLAAQTANWPGRFSGKVRELVRKVYSGEIVNMRGHTIIKRKSHVLACTRTASHVGENATRMEAYDLHIVDFGIFCNLLNQECSSILGRAITWALWSH